MLGEGKVSGIYRIGITVCSRYMDRVKVRDWNRIRDRIKVGLEIRGVVQLEYGVELLGEAWVGLGGFRVRSRGRGRSKGMF